VGVEAIFESGTLVDNSATKYIWCLKKTNGGERSFGDLKPVM
jgi:hypothetical protein